MVQKVEKVMKTGEKSRMTPREATEMLWGMFECGLRIDVGEANSHNIDTLLLPEISKPEKTMRLLVKKGADLRHPPANKDNIYDKHAWPYSIFDFLLSRQQFLLAESCITDDIIFNKIRNEIIFALKNNWKDSCGYEIQMKNLGRMLKARLKMEKTGIRPQLTIDPNAYLRVKTADTSGDTMSMILAGIVLLAIAVVNNLCSGPPTQNKTNDEQKNRQKTEQSLEETKPAKRDNKPASIARDQQERYRFAMKTTLVAMGNRDRQAHSYRQAKYLPQKN